jgi:pimeloyl-ACP methyl ester carboxylesterase
LRISNGKVEGLSMRPTIMGIGLALLGVGAGVNIAQPQNSPPPAPVVHVVPEKADECDPCDRTAVIFVHGIGGSRETWVNSSAGKYWPKLLADDPEIGSKIDIYRVDYPSSLLWNKGSIIEIMKNVNLELDWLFYNRPYQKITMICHSMGGIVCNAYLLHVKARYGHRVLAKFRLIFDMAVPHKGSDYANFIRTISFSPQVRILVTQNDFDDLLNITTTELLAKHLSQGCPSLSTYAGYEGLALQSFHRTTLGIDINIPLANFT